MSIIRQESFFDITELYAMEPTQRFDAILSTINLDPIMTVVAKKSRYGRPPKLNYGAMVQSLIIKYVEGIKEMKELVQRLKNDPFFRFDCGFLVSDDVPSEASYSRMIQTLAEADILSSVQDELVYQAILEGFIQDDVVAIDATHFEARDRATSQEKKSVSKESKDEHSLYDEKVEEQLHYTAKELIDQMPMTPQWGIKKNSDGKNVYWYGFKGHLAVGTESQYILKGTMSSGNLNDAKAAIPLLKLLEFLPLTIRYGTLDAGYDLRPIYQQLSNLGIHGVIAYNRRNEKEVIGFDEHFAPTCVREHSYRYDSYDTKYDTLKFTAPKECHTCPLRHDDLCQKVYKIKRTTDIRKYSAPARGSKKWDHIYKERTAVERVNAYLKEFFGLNNVRHRTGKKAKLHFDFVTLVYNASKLAIDRLNAKVNEENLVG